MANEDDIVQRIIIEGDGQAVAAINRFGQAGATSFRRVQAAADTTSKSVEKSTDAIRQNVDRLLDSFGATGKAASQVGRAVENAFSNLGPAASAAVLAITGITAALAGATTAFFNLAQAASRNAEAVKEGAQATGQSVEDYQKLGFAIEQATKGAANMDTVFNRLNAIIADAGNENSETTKKFRELGVRLTDGAGRARSANDIFLDLADAVGRLDEKTRTATLIGIFGPRQGGLFSALMAQGSKGIKELTADAERLNIVFTKAETEIGDNFGDAMNRLNKVLQVTRDRIGLLFAPQFTEGANALADFIGENQATIVAFGKVVQQVFGDILNALTGNTDKIQSSFIFVIGEGLRLLGVLIRDTVLPLLAQFKTGLDLIIAAINRLFGTNFSASDLAVIAAMGLAIKVFTAFLSVLRLVTSALGIFRIAAIAATIPFSPMILAIGLLVAALVALGNAIVQRAGGWGAILAKGQEAVNGLIVAWQGFSDFFIQLWTNIQLFVQNAWLVLTQGVTIVIQTLMGLWQGFVSFMGSIFQGIAALAQGVWDAVAATATGAVAAIMAAWQGFVEFFMGVWEPILDFVTEVYQTIIDGTNELVSGLTGIWQVFKDSVIGFFTEIRDFIKETWDEIKDIVSQLFGGGGEVGGAGEGGKGFARGGPVWGAGTATSDSIPAWLSNGEFVARAAAVRKYGTGIFHALNNLKLDPDIFRGFALGGLAMPDYRPRLAFAEGGAVRSTNNTLNLSIDGMSFNGLRADDQTMEDLRKFAVNRQVRSAGRKPLWKG